MHRTILVTLAAAGLLALTACGSHDDSPAAAASPARASAGPSSPTSPTAASVAPTEPVTTAEPRTADAVRHDALLAYTADEGGDFEGAYDYFTAATKRLISRADYARALRECIGSGTGNPVRVTNVRQEGAGFVVTVEVGGSPTSRTWVYEGGAWKQVPGPEAVRNFKKGAAAWAADERAQGHCSQ